MKTAFILPLLISNTFGFKYLQNQVYTTPDCTGEYETTDYLTINMPVIEDVCIVEYDGFGDPENKMYKYNNGMLQSFNDINCKNPVGTAAPVNFECQVNEDATSHKIIETVSTEAEKDDFVSFVLAGQDGVKDCEVTENQKLWVYSSGVLRKNVCYKVGGGPTIYSMIVLDDKLKHYNSASCDETANKGEVQPDTCKVIPEDVYESIYYTAYVESAKPTSSPTLQPSSSETKPTASPVLKPTASPVLKPTASPVVTSSGETIRPLTVFSFAISQYIIVQFF